MNQSTFLDDVIDERLPLEEMPQEDFDYYLEKGWRLLGQSLVRHNYSICRSTICQTIPLRICLDQFNPSKSQRQILRRCAHLETKSGAIRLSEQKHELFKLHATRLQERQPASLFSFLNVFSSKIPVPGQEFRIYQQKELLACSFFHLGEEAMSGTYCIYNPAFGQFSLGTYTMLLELLKAKELGKKYYYHGYVYDVPSQFDYKLNFTGLERMDWSTNLWHPMERLPVRRWSDFISPQDLSNPDDL